MRYVVYVLRAPYPSLAVPVERAFFGADSLRGYSPARRTANWMEIKNEFEKMVT